MTAGDLFKAGQLAAACEAQLADVKAHPGDANRRLFLFELSAFSGDLDRARRQVEVVTYDTPELQAAVALYRGALDAEQARRDLTAKGTPPQFFGPPPDHVAKRLEALQEVRAGRPADAAKLLAAANAAAPIISGQLNGKDFEGIRDADDLLGTVLEAYTTGRYYWVPLEQVVSIALNPPQSPRDLLWAPARMTLRDGNSGDVLLPTVYSGTHEQSDDALKLGRATDWITAADDGPTRGVGAKTFLVGDDVTGLLDWRELFLV